MPTFLQGLRRVFNCPKVQVAATGLTTTWAALRFAAADLPPTQRSAVWVAFVGAVAVQLREIINAWTEEDVARVENGLAPAETPLLVSSAVPTTSTIPLDRTPAETTPPRPMPVDPPVLRPAGPPKAMPANPTNPQRSLNMPTHTKLPLVLIAFSTIALLPGCAKCPELAIYREGLHRVDEPLYQSHLLLLDDAVAAGVRADADRQVVRQGVAAARSLYDEAGK